MLQGGKIGENILSTSLLMFISSCYFTYDARIDIVAEKEFDTVIQMTLKRVLVQRFKKKMGEKKYLLTKTCKCYKAITFLWKNDLARVYFNMKQTLRVFLSKV